MGQLASPSFSEGFRWEDSRRRVRVVFADMTIADSKRVMLLHEFGRLPVFYFPMEDVRMDLMEATDHHTSSPLKGEASYWTIRVGNGVAENAAWSYLDPLPGGPRIKGYVAFYWNKMDAWYEEEERVFAHARDPYKRVDILPSSRHVRVVLGGVDVLIASAGVLGPIGPLHRTDPKAWRETIDINLTGTFLTVKYAVPYLKKRGGSVIITSSVGIEPTPWYRCPTRPRQRRCAHQSRDPAGASLRVRDPAGAPHRGTAPRPDGPRRRRRRGGPACPAPRSGGPSRCRTR